MRTWADIRYASLAANLAALRSLLPPRASLLLPVKADAYGHGAAQIARWAEDLGVGWLGVATPEEAAELRAVDVGARILLFGPLPADGLGQLRRGAVTPTLCSRGEALRWAEAAPGAAAHLEIDTGMGRAGFDWRATAELARLRDLSGLALEGAYTHFAAAESDPALTLEQHERFTRALGELARHGLRFPLVHVANSAALLQAPELPADLARPGIAAYGAPGRGARAAAARFEPVLRWWAAVVQLREFAPGDTVGYGCTRVERPTRAALLAVGYGDGYPRSQAGGGWVELSGTRCPVLGRVSMDLTLVDVTDAPRVEVGDAALLLGPSPGLTADDLAERSGTISYEILTGIRRRVERRYLREPAPGGPAEEARAGWAAATLRSGLARSG